MNEITKRTIDEYKNYLIEEEKCSVIIEKNIRDITAFINWTEGNELTKTLVLEYKSMLTQQYIPKTKFEGKTLEENTINDVFAFITLYFFIFITAIFLLSFDPVNGQFVNIASDAGEYTVKHGFFSNFSAVLTCISNVGPAFEAVGPYSSFAGYSAFSKIVLTLTMLLGRLEILPIFILFNPRTWKKV